MYENEEPISRRIVWIVLWFVIIVAVAWAIVWLVFFRNSSTTNQNGGLKSKAPQSQPSQTPKNSQGNSGKQNSNSSNSNSGNGGSANNSGNGAAPTAPASGGSAAPAPNTLANTGAGDVLIPFAAATMVGSAVYYIRLSKKLAHSGDSRR
jgi:cytoskeletal protein RodZ